MKCGTTPGRGSVSGSRREALKPSSGSITLTAPSATDLRSIPWLSAASNLMNFAQLNIYFFQAATGTTNCSAGPTCLTAACSAGGCGRIATSNLRAFSMPSSANHSWQACWPHSARNYACTNSDGAGLAGGHPPAGSLNAPPRLRLNAVTAERLLGRGNAPQWCVPPIVDLQTAINACLAEHNSQPKPFLWTSPPRSSCQARPSPCNIRFQHVL